MASTAAGLVLIGGLLAVQGCEEEPGQVPVAGEDRAAPAGEGDQVPVVEPGRYQGAPDQPLDDQQVEMLRERMRTQQF